MPEDVPLLPFLKSTPHPVSQQEHPTMVCGVLAPLFTPERLDGKIDFDGLEALADHLCRKSSVSSLLLRTNEGRMWSFSLGEIRDAIRCVLAVAKGRKPVLVGACGAWDGDPGNAPRPGVYFRQSVDLSQYALAQGAAAVLQPVPVFLTPASGATPQEAVFRFFEDVEQAVNGPIVVYHQDGIPDGYALTPKALGMLSRREQYKGTIFYTRDAALLGEIVRHCEPGFAVISGYDSVSVPAFFSGVVSSAGALAVLAPEVIRGAWQSLEEPDLPFVWRAQTDLLRIREVLSPWQGPEIGCALLAHQGLHMAGRPRGASQAPETKDVARANKAISALSAAYM